MRNPYSWRRWTLGLLAASLLLAVDSIPVFAAENTNAPAEAEKVWANLLRSLQPAPTPASWQTNQPTQEELAAQRQKNGILASDASERARDFYTRFPSHPRAAEARELELQLLTVSIQLGNTNRLARLAEREQEQLKDPTLGEDARFEIRMRQIGRTVRTQAKTPAESAAAWEKGLRQLQREFPGKIEIPEMFIMLSRSYLEAEDVESSKRLLREVAATKNNPEIQAMAEEELRKVSRVGQPMALQFTAISGSPVDLKDYRGKVVLIDFWASWCGQCLAALPEIKDLYLKLKPQGFEILGINLDRSKVDLNQMLAQEKITWPQYFDGLGWENKISREFGIHSLPTLWLVDKKGVLRSLSAHEQLREKILKLLAEK